MTKQGILNYFRGINNAYNDSTRFDSLSHMIDELMEESEPEPKPVLCMGEQITCKSGFCPMCGKMLNSTCNEKYCGNCGQAVKWDE